MNSWKKTMIELDPQYLKEVKKILARHAPECQARIFGSRVNGGSRKYSDLDIALVCKNKIDWRVIEQIKQAFSESNLPFCVDVLDWNSITDEFKKVINTHYEVL